MFSHGGKYHSAPTSNIKDTHYKGFPKHTELFADDYYDKDNISGDEFSSDPYMGEKEKNDYENFDQANHRKTQTGVLSSYKKQLNLTAKDYME